MTENQFQPTQQARMPDAPHMVAGRYAVQGELGRGGMGIVWRAEDTVIGRAVAIKELRIPDAGEGTDVFQERVLREVRTGGRLNDPAVVTVFDVINEGSTTYIVMELVEAPTLSDLVKQYGPLPAHQVAAIGEQVLSALSSAHKAGIVHRDVKPGNIMVAEDGRVKLTDFGIAQAVDDPRLTTSGFLVGSPAFISPERVEGRAAIPASDVWSLGVTLFYAVEGIVPFDRGTTAATLHSIMNEVPYLTHTQGPLASAIMGMLISTPDARISADQARGLLAMAKSGTGMPPAAGGTQPAPFPGQAPTLVGNAHVDFSGSGQRLSPGKKKAAMVGVTVAAVALLTMGFLAGHWWGSPATPGDRQETLTYGLGGDIPQFSVSTGRCVNAPLDGRAITGNTIECESEHDFQVFADGATFANRGADIEPDYLEDELTAWAEARCELTFRSNVVAEDKRADVHYRTLIPSKQAWELDPEVSNPARTVYCLAVPPDGGRLAGSVLTSDN